MSRTTVRPRVACILGAGPSGLVAAARAARSGMRVLLADHARNPGKKLRISGGGKANITNLDLSYKNYAGENPKFVQHALKRFSPKHMLDWLAQRDIPVEQREYGRIFCKKSAVDVLNALLREAEDAGVEFLFSRRIEGVSGNPEGKGFEVRTDAGPIVCDFLTLALGSPAWPKVGATDLGAKLARSLGHKTIPFAPALTPFVMPEGWALDGLTGISIPAETTCAGHAFTQPVLFTHKGMSGPGILQASLYWKPGLPVSIDFLPHIRLKDEARTSGKQRLISLLCRFLPDRLARKLLENPAVPGLNDLRERKAAELSRENWETVRAAVHAFTVTPRATGGMALAEAASGGVDTAEISPRTMESRLVPGLFIVGELLDITGNLGGFNLHWAFASGMAAGDALSSRDSL